MDGGWNFGGNSVWEKKLAKSMCERFRPSGMDLVRFTNSGTEANTTVLAAAVAITGKKKILVFSSGYHGSTLVFPSSSIQNRIPSIMNLPHEFIYAPYNNIEETRLVLSSADTNSLAAILVEPIQGSGGCQPASPQFLHFLREVADNTKALLIVDEVMASRLGKSGYVAEIGIKADFLTLGKYLGGGMTFGAFGGRRDLMERFDPTKA
ncbi:acetylornithine aminotransferase [Fusarium beomiforme]|uniref:Acetylornithine aminotransferase n=1 Tax=Fusarium beomiforme TaxID=44412 RepID=A0A9P5A7K4_9HYPO|nr:acetylornithine aminotransferase [Fusarium beomiforme]